MSRPILNVGEPAPWFDGRTASNPHFRFDTAAGRYVVLAFLGSAADSVSRELLSAIAALRDRFDDDDLCYFGVSIDPGDEKQGRIPEQIPGIRYFLDERRDISRAFGVIDESGNYLRVVYILDPALRVLSVLPIAADGGKSIARLTAAIEALPPVGDSFPALAQAPVLVAPRIFEPEFCRTLIEVYGREGGEDSGFMRDVKGKTTLIFDYGHKRRRDCTINDDKLQKECMARIHGRLAPQLARAFQFQATRIERHIIACYDATEQGHFHAHRDNTTKGTAHRRFAVSLFLNAGEYEGGLLRFPEYGPALYGAPTGGAVVFSCSMLHEATPVTRGRRFMYLPFLYNEDAKRLREENKQFLDDDLKGDYSEKGSDFI